MASVFISQSSGFDECLFGSVGPGALNGCHKFYMGLYVLLMGRYEILQLVVQTTCSPSASKCVVQAKTMSIHGVHEFHRYPWTALWHKYETIEFHLSNGFHGYPSILQISM